MRNRLLFALGRHLLNRGGLSICIIDDERTYFHPTQLKIAASVGYTGIERYDRVTPELLDDLLNKPRDIVLLDIQGIADEELAKDGFEIADRLIKSTPTYVAITSAHSQHLTRAIKEVDYILERRLLTGLEFVEELETMIADYFRRKTRFYGRIAAKIGFALVRGSFLGGPG